MLEQHHGMGTPLDSPPPPGSRAGQPRGTMRASAMQPRSGCMPDNVWSGKEQQGRWRLLGWLAGGDKSRSLADGRGKEGGQ